MNELLEAAREAQSYILDRQWSFCFIGGLALQRWGEVRFTRDVDATLLTGFGREEAFVDPLLARFEARRPDARDFALRYRVLLLKSSAGVGLDIAMGGLPFEAEVVRRASDFEYAPGCHLRTCSAEDLVVLKSFASRPQDWVDVEGILIRQGASLDRRYITRQLTPLCEAKEDPAILPRLEELFAKYLVPQPTSRRPPHAEEAP